MQKYNYDDGVSKRRKIEYSNYELCQRSNSGQNYFIYFHEKQQDAAKSLSI